MAKQLLISALEEVLGEYIMGMSKENLKIAALKGKIQLKDVLLDGDLVGGHVMGALGLHGFGILSCHAKTLNIHIPWKNLEKEPTRFEIHGLYLVCVPVTPATAHKIYGTGSRVDPRCKLRTRVKRLILARLERNFWNGLIPGEGPPLKRVTRAIKDLERDWKRRSNRRPSNRSAEELEMDQIWDHLMQNVNDSVTSHAEERSSRTPTANGNIDHSNIELPRDWKVKLREKVLRNMEAAIYDVHIRCESSEGDYRSIGGYNMRTATREGVNADAFRPVDERPFVLGITIDSFVVRTANEKWQVGSHDKSNPLDGTAMSSIKGHLGPNPYLVKNNKIGFFQGVSIYWDDLPPFLLSETELLQGNFRKLSPEKILSKITVAMEALRYNQEPGSKVRESLGHASSNGPDVSHAYVCEGLCVEIRVRQSDRTLNGPISCSADVMPLDFTFSVRPHQYIQYSKLKKAVQSQQRFDTMVHQRPTESPRSNPSAWWRYAIACVLSRPNSRPWKDIKLIVSTRNRYIELIEKKNKRSCDSNQGYHSGLSERESTELLSLEDLLPVEALEAFHLLALRRVYESHRRRNDARPVDERSVVVVPEETQSRHRPIRSSGRFRLLSGSGRSRSSAYSELDDEDEAQVTIFASHTVPVSLRDSSSTFTSPLPGLLETMTLRLGPKPWFVDWKLHQATVSIAFLGTQDMPLGLLTVQGGGSIRSFGRGKRDTFIEFTRIDLGHSSLGQVLFFQSGDSYDSLDEDWNSVESVGGDGTVTSSFSAQSLNTVLGPDLLTASRFLALPPRGVVCRIAAGKDLSASRISMSAHPATLSWTPALFDSFMEFMNVKQSAEFQHDIGQRLRNAATPLAQKAQLAMLSPSLFSLHVNISAPKIYVPVKSKTSNGSLFVDAGTLKLACVKDEGETDVSFDLSARDIRVNFIRGKTFAQGSEQIHFQYMPNITERFGRSETTIIHPFHISVDARSNSNCPAKEILSEWLKSYSGLVRNLDVVISPVSLNLVDAEVLARAFGKWYARVIHTIRSRGSTSLSRDLKFDVDKANRATDRGILFHDSIPRILSITLDKLEIALEGHSRSQTLSTDDRSLVSQDSLHEIAPSTRTYLIEFNDIMLRQVQLDQLSKTTLSVVDISITRLRDGCVFAPLKGRSTISDYCILENANRSRSGLTDDRSAFDPGGHCILRASLVHDRFACYDEVDVEIDSVTLRVTPMTLKDCTKAARQVAEFTQIVTKELERKVHEEGRRARNRVAVEPNCPDGVDPSNRSHKPAARAGSSDNADDARNDSSILFRVTVRGSTLLAGRPISAIEQSSVRHDKDIAFAVLQVLGNALIMFQSIENPDASGSKTIHVSVDSVSSIVHTEFERVSPTDAPPMIGPFAAEFRVVYATENFGSIVSQNIALDFGGIKSCMTPNDAFIMMSICSKMLERLRAFGSPLKISSDSSESKRGRALASLLRYQRRGTGIATRIDMDLQAVSFVLLKAYKSMYGAPEFIDFRLVECKGRLDGCISALSGDCSAVLSAKVFNAEVAEWDFALEPFPISLKIEQMPNEMLLDLSSTQYINMNFTGLLLREIAELRFDIVRDRNKELERGGSILTQSALSTVGLRRAIESRSVCILNRCGLDILVTPVATEVQNESKVIVNGADETLDMGRVCDEGPKLVLRMAPSSAELVGAREPIWDLPVTASTEKVPLFLLKPREVHEAIARNEPDIFDGFGKSRPSSPSTNITEGSESERCIQSVAEPVIEWCMENQRLRPAVVDVYSLEKGHDLLSNMTWSPDDFVYDDSVELKSFVNDTNQPLVSREKSSRASITHAERLTCFRRKSNWGKPYLNNDAPEWTDMTCTLRMARERVMLPDSNWMWANEWTVDLTSDCADSDGWEYAADFETFTRVRRNYERGDSCRRRRWIRTRIVKPSSLHLRQLKLVWESREAENGNYLVTVRSHLRCSNRSGTPLSIFLFCPSWVEDVFAGTLQPTEELCVPLHLASAVFMRLALPIVSKGDRSSIHRGKCTDRFCILPTSHTSTSLLRITMELTDDVSRTRLHFVVRIDSNHGLVDVFIDPVLKLVNLLPCALECQFGELVNGGGSVRKNADIRPILGKKDSAAKRVALCETLNVEPGKESSCIALTPWKKPHISLRVPGYEWSAWHRIVNRKPNDDTWRPPDEEEDFHLSSKGDGEYKTCVRFDRLISGGDCLNVVLSVESGHCPTIRVYSQFWILDKTGFGCRFAEGFSDILSSSPDVDTSRRSHLLPGEAKVSSFRREFRLAGHEWSVGMCGMTMYFSRRETLTLAIESGCKERNISAETRRVKSKWVSPLDISNVVPKTVFSVEEANGPRQFELCISVTVCPGLFKRTRLITLVPRYQIVNLLHRELLVAQDGCLSAASVIPSQSSVPFHWANRSSALKLRLGAPSVQDKVKGSYVKSRCWTIGCIRADRVGISSIRLPTGGNNTRVPLVVQVEVRLASKEQASAVIIVISVVNEKSNPLYVLRNRSRHRILCRQPLHDLSSSLSNISEKQTVGGNARTGREKFCGIPSRETGEAFCTAGALGPMLQSIWSSCEQEEFVWILNSSSKTCFGFDDPEKEHILQWTCVDRGVSDFGQKASLVEIDAMGSTSVLRLSDGNHVLCQMRAEHSTKVVEFTELDNFPIETPRSWNSGGGTEKQGIQRRKSSENSLKTAAEEDEDPAFSLRMNLPGLEVSIIDNGEAKAFGREIMLLKLDNIFFTFSQTREGHHEFEFTLLNFQADNHVSKSIHPVLVFCPRTAIHPSENLLHLSAVRRLQRGSSTLVFRYAAFRLLEIEIFLDRRTADCVARFLSPLAIVKEEETIEPGEWLTSLTVEMNKWYVISERKVPHEFEQTINQANTGRIYFEQLHLHPVRIGLTFTQEWIDSNHTENEAMMFFQFIRGMASIANASLFFTSFVVGHVFEAPDTLVKIVTAHYSSQLTRQIFKLLGSLAILGAPADFLTNVGTGVRDFFYEPIQGAVLGPKEFIQGLDRGTQSLARGLFVGIVRGTANVTDVVNTNLARLTADEDFIDERKAHQRMLTDAMSRGIAANRSLGDSFGLAGASLVRSLRSGAMGMLEKPSLYASKHGPVGFVKGLGKGLVGAILKPVVGFGDAAVLVMNHMSDATSKQQISPKVPKRLRRALPCRSLDHPNCVRLDPYDEKAAKAQKIVTGSESVDDVYIGHLNTPSHLIIASENFLWAIDRRTRDPWCVSWAEISHFATTDSSVRVVIFSQTGLKTFVFDVDDKWLCSMFQSLLAMQQRKMGNSSELNSSILSAEPESISRHQIPGIKAPQINHVFGSCNQVHQKLGGNIKDEIDLVEQCFARVREMSSSSSTFFRSLDEEAWSLVCSWGQVFSGLSSRRCIVASIINGTRAPIQVKSTKLIEGGSPCYSIPTREFDMEQGILHPGGVILFFGWGTVPSLLQPGRVFMHIETNAFTGDFSDQKSPDTFAEAMPGFQVGFLEKSYDEFGWWSKFWLLVRTKT